METTETVSDGGQSLDYSSVAQDKDFLAAPRDQQLSYLSSIDPAFAKASPSDKLAYLTHITEQTANPPSAPQPDELNQMGRDIGGALLNLGKGALKAALPVMPAPADRGSRSWLYRATHPMVPIPKTWATPQGTAQGAGFDAERAAEFLAPGGAEEKAGAKAAELAARYAPTLAKIAGPAARTLTGALGTGLVNKAQGGSFKEGAATGGAFGAAGEAGRALAPKVAESALGVTKRLRGFGKTPGQAALEEIRGVRPATMERNAQIKTSQLTQELERRANNIKQPIASTRPALDAIDEEMARAEEENAQDYYEMLAKVKTQITKEFRSGKDIPENLTPMRLLKIKRGIGKLERSWNPDTQGFARGFVKGVVYPMLDSELDRTVPGARELNQRISSLIPVAERSESIARNAGVVQRVAHRAAAHTGALAGALGGGFYANALGHGPIIGAAAGLIGPEVATMPMTQMIGARALRSPFFPRFGRGAALNVFGSRNRNPDEVTDDEQ